MNAVLTSWVRLERWVEQQFRAHEALSLDCDEGSSRQFVLTLVSVGWLSCLLQISIVVKGYPSFRLLDEFALIVAISGVGDLLRVLGVHEAL